MKTLIFAENEKMFAQCAAGACTLGESTAAVVIGTEEEGKQVGKYGIDQVFVIAPVDGAMLEDYTETIAEAVKASQADLVIVESSKRGKLIAGRIAAKNSTSVVTDVMEFTNEGLKRMVFGGVGIRTEKSNGVTIATVGSGLFEVLPEDPSKQAEVTVVQYVEPKNKLKLIGQQEKPKVSADLPSAKRVIGVGRGLAKEEDLALIRELADAIGAEVGCSRPIAEGEQWMPKETYVGVSGQMISPDVYIAIGISGQVQHMVGVNGAKTIISINKDDKAPIFSQSDYGIAGDLYKVVPALIKEFSLVKA